MRLVGRCIGVLVYSYGLFAVGLAVGLWGGQRTHARHIPKFQFSEDMLQFGGLGLLYVFIGMALFLWLRQKTTN